MFSKNGSFLGDKLLFFGGYYLGWAKLDLKLAEVKEFDLNGDGYLDPSEFRHDIHDVFFWGRVEIVHTYTPEKERLKSAENRLVWKGWLVLKKGSTASISSGDFFSLLWRKPKNPRSRSHQEKGRNELQRRPPWDRSSLHVMWRIPNMSSVEDLFGCLESYKGSIWGIYHHHPSFSGKYHRPASKSLY